MLSKIQKRATAWRPLVLYWRRRRVLQPTLKKARVSSRVSISYFPQIHFHFTTQLNTLNRERVLRERCFGTRIYTDKTQTILKGQCLLRTNCRTSSRRTNYITSSKHSALIRKIQHSRTSASVLSVFTVLRNTRREELIKAVNTQSHLREHQSRILSFRSTYRESLIKSARVQFDRTEELVWRSHSQRRTVVTEEVPVAHNTEITQRQTVHTAAVTANAQNVSASSNNLTTPQQITKFDSSLLDRLTDDVIRRVEKRALIERQRRGL